MLTPKFNQNRLFLATIIRLLQSLALNTSFGSTRDKGGRCPPCIPLESGSQGGSRRAFARWLPPHSIVRVETIRQVKVHKIFPAGKILLSPLTCLPDYSCSNTLSLSTKVISVSTVFFAKSNMALIFSIPPRSSFELYFQSPRPA